MSLAWSAYRILAPAIGALAPAARWFASPHERHLWNERLGQVAASGSCDAWIHAASLGEAVGVPPFAAALAADQPGSVFHLTSTTRTGRGRLAALGTRVSLAPLDAPQSVRQMFERVGPRRLFLVETELWPHWLMRARELGVPVAVVSARLSKVSVERYRRFGPAFRSLVGGLAGVVAQTGEDGERWLAIGAPADRLAVGGNLKHDALPAPASSRPEAREAMGLDPGRPLLVLGSLRPGEARLLARAWLALPDRVRGTWQVVAVPRHARATRELMDEAAAAGVRAAQGVAPVAAWSWDDRPGILLRYYAGADVAFVGGSLVRRGGHNPLEAAACGAAVLMGPHHASQLAGVRALEAAGAIVIVPSPAKLREMIERLLTDDGVRERSAAAGIEVARALRGAARRTVARLEAWNLWPPR